MNAELRHALLPFASPEFRSLRTEIVNLKTILESKHWYTRVITGTLSLNSDNVNEDVISK